jgi:translation initiation factor 4E
MADVEVPQASEAEIVQEEESINDDGVVSTVFMNPRHYTLKHPLRHNWTLWYDIPTSKVHQGDWFATLKQIYTFRFVEDFWGYVWYCPLQFIA